jgi:DNA-binding MurR/RpiR family transcriptional regulator
MDARNSRPEEVIQRRWDTLSSSQRRFAKLVMDDPQIVAVNSAGAVSRRLGVATSTVVRAAMALGYDGYPDLQEAVQRQVFARSNLLARLEATERTAANSPLGAVRSTFTADIDALQLTLSELDTKRLNKLVSALIRARRVYVFGLGVSYAPAYIMATGLRQLGRDARLSTGAVSDIADELHGATAEDMLLTIAMPRYPARTVQALEFAKRRRMRRGAITDNAASPLAARADHVLYVRQAEFRYFQSAVPTLSAVNALLAGIAVALNGAAHSSLALMDQEWRDSDAFVGDPAPES